jgi:hypothetical protein
MQTKIYFILFGMSVLLSTGAFSQEYYNYLKPTLGWEIQPSDDTPVDLPEFYGDINDMSGGYAVGDTVHDFTAYDFYGNSITLSEQLTVNRPLVLINGSVSCLRFRNTFDTTDASPEYGIAQQFLWDHEQDFNWVFIYNMEAHPDSGACPSNCPAVPNLDTVVVQHVNYVDRRYAMHDWLESDSTFNFPFNMYCDNPDNGIYNHFFRRPYGILTLNCEGIVTNRGNWAHQWIAQNTEVLEQMMVEDFQTCQSEAQSVDQVNEESVTVGPVPFNDILTISHAGVAQRILIYDVTGKTIYDQTVNQTVVTIDTLDWPAGSYVLMLPGDQSTETRLLLKY